MGQTTAEETTPDAAPADSRAERRARRLARQIGSFARSHGGSVEGQIAYLGSIGARIVLVGEDGQWGDLVAPSVDTARRAVELSGITTHDELGGELAAKVRTGRYEWKRMAGTQLGGPANA